MSCDFASGFAPMLNKFIEQKNALGYSYAGYNHYLRRFDEMCVNQYPLATELTRDIGWSWAVKTPAEDNNAFRNRMSPVREFARFLVRNGEKAFVIPIDLVRKKPPQSPYIYTKEEIAAIWDAFDAIKPVPTSQTRHIVLPAIVRLLYCCGLRPAEARRLSHSDVDLKMGKLFIHESKGHKDRIVMMAADVTEYMRGYDRKINRAVSERAWFFPSPNGVICTNSFLDDNFNKIRSKLNIPAVCGRNPRLYDLRHTFATHRLYEWLQDGKDLSAMLPYLSAYMGHAQLSDTYYYIHLVPEQLRILSGLDFSRYEALLPEVEDE